MPKQDNALERLAKIASGIPLNPPIDFIAYRAARPSSVPAAAPKSLTPDERLQELIRRPAHNNVLQFSGKYWRQRK